MSLPISFHLGQYEILSFLGRGGMGEVYLARDERLGRTVALKVLPEELAQDAHRLLRFEREAKALSALNHPNIVTIHEFACSSSLSYIVMEFVEGRTLRSLVGIGSLPIRQVLDVAAQVASGLAAAHAIGIVHRDLKPENIMIAKSGFLKILDFGLAKAQPSTSEAGDLSAQGVTPSAPRTFIGTPAYMSPEQASGLHVDYRSDQFSLGVILFEMATARNPFRRAETVETMGAIIRQEPPLLRELRPEAPAPFRWVVERCLCKEPSARFDSTSDLARALEAVRDNVHELAPRPPIEPPTAIWRRIRWVLPAAAAVAAIGLGVWLSRPPLDVGSPVVSFTVPPPPGATFNFSNAAPAPVALSPDGR
jgi:serine/threonine protein kinase